MGRIGGRWDGAAEDGTKKGAVKMTDHFHSLFKAEKEGFEPSRLLQPTGVRSRTLQPLGYFSSMRQNDFCNISILAEKRSICKQKFEFSQNGSA